eukprot:EG_transcript_12185
MRPWALVRLGLLVCWAVHSTLGEDCTATNEFSMWWHLMRTVHRGAGLPRTVALLRQAQQHGVVFHSTGSAFDFNVLQLRRAFRKVHATKLHNGPQDWPREHVDGEQQVRVLFSAYVGGGWPNWPAFPEWPIIIQSEQVIANQGVMPGRLGSRCKAHPRCVIWEFADGNVQKYAPDHPVVLLPMVMFQAHPASLPAELKPLRARQFDAVHFGSLNDRRQQVLRALRVRGLRLPFQNEAEMPRKWDAYREARVCFANHYYGVGSSFEFHRFSEHMLAGCLPVYEEIADPVLREWLALEGGVIFAKHEDMAERIARLLDYMRNNPEGSQRLQDRHIAFWRDQLRLMELTFLYALCQAP